MNILQIVSASRTGGVERHVVVLSEILRRRGHNVTAICPPGEWLPDQLRHVGVPVEEIIMRGMEFCKIARLLPQFVRSHNIDLIHSHLTRATYFACYTGRMARLPVVSSVHVMTRDIAYRRLFRRPGHQIVTVSEYLRQALLHQGIPGEHVRTIHNGTDFCASELPTPGELPLASEWPATETENLRELELCATGARRFPPLPEAADVETTLRALSGARGMESIGGGREMSVQSRPRQDVLTVHSEWSIPQDAELIGLFARMEEFKGPFVLTQAARQIVTARPRAYIFFVGPIEPNIQQELSEIADADGVVDRLRFTGQRDDVRRLMSAMDVVTLPSRYEACSMAILEAMALGKPVVATRAGGNPELIRDGETGLLIERTPDALAQAIIRLLSDPSQRAQMGAAAHNRAQTSFSAGVMVSQIESLYHEMLTQTSR